MSQITSLQKAEKHCEKVRVLVATTVVAVRNAQAPVGSGSRTSPGPPQHRHMSPDRNPPEADAVNNQPVSIAAQPHDSGR